MSNPTKKELALFIRVKLGKCKKWAIHGLKTVYHNQTVEEKGLIKTEGFAGNDHFDDDEENTKPKFKGHSIYKNRIGFTRIDAPILVSIYQFVKEKGVITAKQLALVHRYMPKYWKQIYDACDKDKLIEQYFSEMKIKQ